MDLLPSTVSLELDQRLGDWWTLPWARLVEFRRSPGSSSISISRYPSRRRRREILLIQVDGPRISSDGPYEKIGMGNGRLRGAVQGLIDLGLIGPTRTSCPS